MSSIGKTARGVGFTLLLAAWLSGVLVFAIFVPYSVYQESQASRQLVKDTEDYSFSTCGCGSSSAAKQLVVAEKLRGFLAFGQHPLINPYLGSADNQTLVALNFGQIHKIFVAWQTDDILQYTELSPEDITVVIDEAVPSPTIQWKWSLNSLSYGKWEQKDLGHLATQPTIRLTSKQHQQETALKNIKPTELQAERQ